MAVQPNRAVRALKRPANWVQLLKFGIVGASGYVINLAIYATLLELGPQTARVWPYMAAAVSFVVSATNNYWWNRHWTFAGQKGNFALQGGRFLVVSLAALAVNWIWLFVFLEWVGLGRIVSQALAIIFVMPLNFIGNKLWSFRR